MIKPGSIVMVTMYGGKKARRKVRVVTAKHVIVYDDFAPMPKDRRYKRTGIGFPWRDVEDVTVRQPEDGGGRG
jgi:hypothetical protein